MPPPPSNPPLRAAGYNRLWHLDVDDRHHHGRRRWDPALLEALIDRLSRIPAMYPPDYTDPQAIVFHAAAHRKVLEARTGDADHVELVFPDARVPLRTLRQLADPDLQARLDALA